MLYIRILIVVRSKNCLHHLSIKYKKNSFANTFSACSDPYPYWKKVKPWFGRNTRMQKSYYIIYNWLRFVSKAMENCWLHHRRLLASGQPGRSTNFPNLASYRLWGALNLLVPTLAFGFGQAADEYSKIQSRYVSRATENPLALASASGLAVNAFYKIR